MSMAAAIKYFELNTGAKIPSVGLGTFQSDPGVVGQAVEAAIKVGYRHIDCAQIYRNEKEIGEVLKKLFENGVSRGKIFLLHPNSGALIMHLKMYQWHLTKLWTICNSTRLICTLSTGLSG